MLNRLFFLTVLTLTLVLSGCRKEPDGRLVEISEIVSDNPREALEKLDSIDAKQLSTNDRHFRDFLLIKGKDKAYITHQSDSLYLDVVKYYDGHKGDKLYPEVLYYGGRVYSDLGDYPTALDYFQRAMDNVEDENLDLKVRIFSQTGRLLDILKLFKEAIPYVEESIQINKLMNDTLNLIGNLNLLGDIYRRADDYDRAELIFKEALRLSNTGYSADNAQSLTNLALIKRLQGDIDSALILVRGTWDEVHPISRNFASVVAAGIYLYAGKTDTAFYLARNTLENDNINNQIGAYEVLLNSRMIGYLNVDSLREYILDYYHLLEKRYNQNETNQALIQHSAYNYTKAEKEKERAEKSYKNLRQLLNILLIFILILIIVSLIIKNRNKDKVISLHDAIEKVQFIKLQINKKSTNVSNLSESIHITSEKEILRERLREELLLITQREDFKDTIKSSLTETEAYKLLMNRVESNKIISNDVILWKELENTVLFTSPMFISNLKKLTKDNISEKELQIAILIKYGLSSKVIGELVGISRTGVNSRRESISKKIFGENIGIDLIDRIIQKL